MYFLRNTSELIERFRRTHPQYWHDLLHDRILQAHQEAGQGDRVTMTGQVLAIVRHQPLEREMVMPGLGIVLPFQQMIARLGEDINRMAYLASLAKTLNKDVFVGVNLVTNDGDVYYAQQAHAGTPTDDFDAAAAGLRLGSAATAPTKTDTDVNTFLSGTNHAHDGSYPTSNDSDPDNTGAGVDILTWRISYLTSEGNATGIQEGAIVDNHTTPTAALTHFLFAASFNKTASDTLKVIVNNEFLGV